MFADTLELASEDIFEDPIASHSSGMPGIQQIRGNNIRIERIHLGQSRKEFAKSVGIREDYLRKIEEGGAIPRTGKLALIAKRLRCTVADLDR